MYILVYQETVIHTEVTGWFRFLEALVIGDFEQSYRCWE